MEKELNLKIFSERLSYLIKERQTDISFLTNQLGLKSKSTVYRYMNGEMSPKLTTIKCLADFYNVNPEWLMGYDVPMEKEIPYSAIYDFSNESDKKLLNAAIVYAIQNNLSSDSVQNNEYIKDCIDKLSNTDKSQMLLFITNIATKFKGKDDFSLEEYIQSLGYKSSEESEYTPEIRAIARGVAKLKPDKKELFKNLLKQMSDEADEASKK